MDNENKEEGVTIEIIETPVKINVPEPQILSTSSIQTSEGVQIEDKEYKNFQISILQKLSILENSLYKRSKKGKISRRWNLLIRINSFRKLIGMPPAKLQDF